MGETIMHPQHVQQKQHTAYRGHIRGADTVLRKSPRGTILAPQSDHPLASQVAYIEALPLPLTKLPTLTKEKQQRFLSVYCVTHQLTAYPAPAVPAAHRQNGKSEGRKGYFVKLNNTKQAWDNFERQARRYGYSIRRSSRTDL